jgi:hypothetical protein
MKKILLILLALTSFIFVNAQLSKVNNSVFINRNQISFFDKDFANKLNSRLANFNSQNQINPKINNYLKLINNYHYLQTGSKEAQIYKSNNLVFDLDNSPQFLNDSLLILNGGKIFNLGKDDFEYIKINGNPKAQILFLEEDFETQSSQPPLKSDLITSYGYINNILTGKGFLGSEDLRYFGIYNNKFSKYILASLRTVDEKMLFMNRYNSNETLNYSQLEYINDDVFTYSDSVYYIPVKLSQIKHFKLLDYEFNTPINIENQNIFFNEEGNWNSEVAEVMDKYNYKLGECYYYYEKYNKVNLRDNYVKGEGIKSVNATTTYENLFDESPTLILEYNFKSQKLTGILDRLIIPFNKINKLILDKFSRFLFIQDGNLITIFDLLTKKELITFSGQIDNIDDQNYLNLNLYANYIAQGKDKYGMPKKNISTIFIDQININDLYKTSNIKYLDDIDKLDIDEFTTKEEFQKKLNIQINQQHSLFSQNVFSENITLPINETITLPSDEIVNRMTTSIENHIQLLNENLLRDSLQLNLTYDNYSFDNKSISLRFDLNETNLVEPFLGFRDRFFKNIDFEFEGQKLKLNILSINCSQENLCSIEISGIEPEFAKKIKSGTINSSIVLTSSLELNSTIPSYDSIFILENDSLNSYFEKASSSFLHHKYNVVNLKLGNKIVPVSKINLIELNKKILKEDKEYTITIIEKESEN